ncbi:MAG: 30S ribosomal protein S4 [Candidatus Liptonbacteria bacterium]|nr:30S ribosomal protein S4 [Candidatus Liptonbacteria bacterium]
MIKILEKKERALGTKLFIKGERCSSSKCAMVKRPYRPGQHNKKFRKISEYGRQLAEKQKIRFSYGLKEKEIKQYFVLANKSNEPTDIAFIKLLEKRLDNVVFRLGLAPSRRVARQLVSHGHIKVNKKKTTIPSFIVKLNDEIVLDVKKESPLIKDLDSRLKNYKMPLWFDFDKEKLIGKVLVEPKDIDIVFDLNLIINYYSR